MKVASFGILESKRKDSFVPVYATQEVCIGNLLVLLIEVQVFEVDGLKEADVHTSTVRRRLPCKWIKALSVF
jgi:hypothetical protein